MSRAVVGLHGENFYIWKIPVKRGSVQGNKLFTDPEYLGTGFVAIRLRSPGEFHFRDAPSKGQGMLSVDVSTWKEGDYVWLNYVSYFGRSVVRRRDSFLRVLLRGDTYLIVREAEHPGPGENTPLVDIRIFFLQTLSPSPGY